MADMSVWTADDGASIPIERVGVGRPVVLVHGGFTDSSGLQELAERLSSRRTVIRYDRRGRPNSADYVEGHSLDRDMRDLAGIVDDLAHELGNVVVVGHSAGAHVALGAALSGAAVRALLLYEPPTFGEPKVDSRTWQELDRAARAGDRATVVSIVLNDVVGRSTGTRIPAEVMPAVLESPFGKRVLRNALAAPAELRAYEGHIWTDEQMMALSVPTTAVVGADSPAFNRMFSDRLAALSMAVSVSTMPDADHGLPETDPARLEQAILDL